MTTSLVVKKLVEVELVKVAFVDPRLVVVLLVITLLEAVRAVIEVVAKAVVPVKVLSPAKV